MPLCLHEPPERLVASTIRKLLQTRGAGKTICPSEVARAIDPERFRALMPSVRAVVAKLVAANELVVTQKGKVVDLAIARGPVRVASAVERRAAYTPVRLR